MNYIKGFKEINRQPIYLIKALFLSFFVMFFISIFVGSVGGIQAFLGFFVVYYWLRCQGDVERDRVKGLFALYSLTYFVVWFIVKLISMYFKTVGWGNFSRMSVADYFVNLYGSTMIEKWAYVFAGILMFSYIMSLFPLIVIKKLNHWLQYLIACSALYAVICFGISRLSFRFVPRNMRSRAVGVLDILLLCELPKNWEATLYIVVLVIFTLLTVWGSYWCACKLCEINKGEVEKPTFGKIKLPVKIASFSLVVVIAAAAFIFLKTSEPYPKYKKVAECLTDDSVLGPIVYKNQIYVPTDMGEDLIESGKPIGYVGDKDEDCTSRFYQLAIGNVLYAKDGKSGIPDYLQMEGQSSNYFQRVNLAEEKYIWSENKVFLLWDEDWSSESKYSHEVTGYSECSADLIRSLEDKFGEVEYKKSDFDECEAYFTIRGYSDMQSMVESEVPYGNWIGCILVRYNSFYYGSYDNRITGQDLEALLQVLGGNQ